MEAMMTKEKLMDRLRMRVDKYDTNREAAAALDISPSHLGDVLAGKREPAGKLLVSLGVTRVTSYKEIA
jgi:hypothetical protein